MPVNLKIAHKGLILVAVPLICELAFVGFLVLLQTKADEETMRQAQLKEILAETNDLSGKIMDAATGVLLWRLKRTQSLMNSYDSTRSNVSQIYDHLDALTATNPLRHEQFSKLKESSQNVFRLTDSLGENENVDLIANKLDLVRKAKLAYEQYRQRAAAFTAEIRTAQNPAAEMAAKERVRYALIAGAFATVSITIWLALFFSRNITGRLAVLTDNNWRLSERAPLNLPIGGGDEIAEVDSGFHKMADALKKAEQQKQEFVQMISHDLGTPLASIKGSLALASRGVYGELSEKGKTRIEGAELDAERLINMINELLDIEKMETGGLQLELETMSIKVVINRACESVRVFAEQHHVHLESIEDDCEIVADSNRLIRVVINLLSNAVKFSPPESKISVSIEKEPTWLTVRVQDQGRGIPAAYIAKIFDRFAQVERSDDTEKKGKGLGLAICKAIIDAHHGQIGVRSEEGNGSVFWFKVPRDLKI